MIEEKQYNAMMGKLTNIETEVGSISRAIYGDKVNQVPGLIDRQNADEVELKKLKDFRKKVLWGTGGFLIAFEVLHELIPRMIS